MLFIYFRNEDEVAKEAALEIITEGKTYDLGKGWSVRRDRSHHDPTTHHNHLQCKGRDVSVINADGTQSHNTNRDKVPQRVVDWLVARKYIKEDTDWLLSSPAIDPAIADKARRIEKYGETFELVLVPAVLRLLGR